MRAWGETLQLSLGRDAMSMLVVVRDGDGFHIERKNGIREKARWGEKWIREFELAPEDDAWALHVRRGAVVNREIFIALLYAGEPLAFELTAPRIGTVSGIGIITAMETARRWTDAPTDVRIDIRPAFDSEYFDPRPPIVRITVEPSQW